MVTEIIDSSLLRFVNLERTDLPAMVQYLSGFGIAPDSTGDEPSFIRLKEVEFAEILSKEPYTRKVIDAYKEDGCVDIKSAIEALLQDFKWYHEAFYKFFERCSRSDLNTAFISVKLSKLFDRGIEDVWLDSLVSDPWDATANFRFKLEDVFDELDFLLIRPFLIGKQREYQKVRRCEVCNMFFVPGSRKGKFCGSECRGKYFYRKKLETDLNDGN